MSFGRWMRNTLTGGWLILLALIVPLTSCNKSAGNTTQATFTSPDGAGQALLQAAKSGDQDKVLAIFGPGSKQVIYSGDAVQDKETAEAFIAAYQEMNRWRKLDDKTQILIVGADNNPFPIPLRKNDAGQWYFDTQAGKDEILARRIGRDELAAIEVCEGLAEAQDEYFSLQRDGSGHQYALKFISSSGRQDGLYWDPAEGQPKSPLGPLVAYATGEGYDVHANPHEPFYGYYFRMLNKQGSHARGGAKDYGSDGKLVKGFAFVAFPAEYGVSGVMSFIINQDGVVYQKDLGKSTIETVAAMSEFDPDKSWSAVE